jgi:hypothetical protein
MAAARPDAAWLTDPRLPKLVAGAMRKHGIPEYLDDQIRNLVSGKSDPRTYQCCHTGCQPCVQDIMGCAATVLGKLARPKKRFWFF